MSAASASGVVQHALHDQRLDLAGLLRLENPVGVANRAVRARIEHVEHLDLRRRRPPPAAEMSAGPLGVAGRRSQGRARRARSARQPRGILNFVPRRLRLLARAPAERDAAGSAPPMLPKHEQFFERRVAETRKRTLPDRRPLSTAIFTATSASAQAAAAGRGAASRRAAGAGGDRFRSSGSRSGRCRTSSSC